MIDHFLAALGVFFPLLLGAVGFPFPEEAVLPAGGISAHPSAARLSAILVGGYLGVVVADNILFAAGRFFGPHLLANRRTGALLSAERLAKVQRFLERRGILALVGLRLTPGVRTGAYLSLGMLGYPWRIFAIVDGFMAMLTVPALVTAGFLLGPRWEELASRLPPVWMILGAAAVPLLGWTLYRKIRPVKVSKVEPESPPEPPAPETSLEETIV